MRPKALISWSGGKDSALCLNEVLKNRDYEIAALVTTMTVEYARVSMHGIRWALLEGQARSLGFKVEKVPISKNASNAEYESSLERVLLRYRDEGVWHVIYGDIFLEDVRAYRERHLERLGMRPVFPIWKKDSGELARGFIGSGFRAVTVCVDSAALGEEFAGREYNYDFLSELPSGIDPCGENGEFHTFVYDGPPFSRPVGFAKGEVVLRDNRFYFCDLLPLMEE